jgi:TetR/AcrR family transcriptional repressor of nem operon
MPVLDTSPAATSETKTRIVEAAKRLFWEQGYHAVSTDAICRAAGISKGSLYHAFPSKEHVLFATIESVFETTWAQLSAIYAVDRPIAETFRRHLGWFHSSQQRLRVRHGHVMGPFNIALGVAIPESALKLMVEHRRLHVELMKKAVGALLGTSADHPTAILATRIILDAITGAMVEARVEDDLTHLAALPDTAFKLIEALAAPRAAAAARSPS